MFKGGIKGNEDVFIGMAGSFVYLGCFGVSALLIPNGYLLMGSPTFVQSKDIRRAPGGLQPSLGLSTRSTNTDDVEGLNSYRIQLENNVHLITAQHL